MLWLNLSNLWFRSCTQLNKIIFFILSLYLAYILKKEENKRGLKKNPYAFGHKPTHVGETSNLNNTIHLKLNSTDPTWNTTLIFFLNLTIQIFTLDFEIFLNPKINKNTKFFRNIYFWHNSTNFWSFHDFQPFYLPHLC